MSHKGQSMVQGDTGSQEELEPSALRAWWVRKLQSASDGYSAFSLASAQCRYISLPIMLDQSTQLVPGGSSDNLTYHVFRHVTSHETRYTLDGQEVHWSTSGRLWEWSTINKDMWHQWKDNASIEGQLLLAQEVMTHCTAMCSLGSAIVSDSLILDLTHTPIYGIIAPISCSITGPKRRARTTCI